MVAISFYQPGSVDLTLDFPQEWNELLTGELEAISRHQLTDYASSGEQRVAIFRDLLQLRAADQNKKLPPAFFARLDPEQTAVNGLQLLDFIYGENTRTKQPYPTLKIKKGLLCCQPMEGPGDDFNNLTCGEFEDCEIFFHQFREAPAPEHLARLAAVLFRPLDTPYLQFSPEKNKYIPYDVETVYPHFRRIDDAILLTIFTWYSGCREMLPKYFQTAFESDGDSSGGPDFLAFTKCIHSGAGPKNGDRDKIRNTGLKEFFLELELEAQKAKELRRQYEQMKR